MSVNGKDKNGKDLNRLIDIRDPDTGYELVKKHYNRYLETDINGYLVKDKKKIKQPKVK